MTAKKQYTKELKLDAVGLVLDQGHTTSEVSRSLEISVNQHAKITTYQHPKVSS
ncbi:transposase [Nitrosomonas ureae]|uniref:Transposase n=1 Tax=Nitrosomonas ureae TaxID=44577 RepID=A0A1H5X9P8_9PROT|nr:transposase [Nitrosomonas ureae]